MSVNNEDHKKDFSDSVEYDQDPDLICDGDSLKNFELSDSFLCGVVEGFYGLPWTNPLRFNLMSCLQKLKMNTYIYAPKNDDKHRKYWKELYTPTECESFSALIKHSLTCDIEFVYSLSPGLDICYGSLEDRKAIVHKLRQIQKLGCRNFALFFDDIEPELCDKDSLMYPHFGYAQADITNYIYERLEYPSIFLFCPTEYCSSRAKPSVFESIYLKVLAEELDLNIKIMWTGPRVISKTISLENILSVSKVLRRRPVIWDNLHANDYDKHQIFLGPYEGRSITLYPHLSGVFINPNCQYQLNFIPIYSFSLWISACRSAYKAALFYDEIDINVANRLEITKEYDSEAALIKCSKLWCKCFTYPSEETPPLRDLDDSQLSSNSYIDFTSEFIHDDTSKSPSSDISTSTEPNISEHHNETNDTHIITSRDDPTHLDIYRIANFCYLPSKMGAYAKKVLSEFVWIKSTSSNYWRLNSIDCTLKRRLKYKRSIFINRCSDISISIDRIMKCPNRVLKILLSPFLLEIKESISALSSYVQYLERREEEMHSDDSIAETDKWAIRNRFSIEVEKLIPSLLFDESCAKIDDPTFVYIIRPHIQSDIERVGETCYQHMIHRFGAWDNIKLSKQLVRLRYLDSFFQSGFEMMVVEDNEGRCGYLLLTANSNIDIEKRIKHDYDLALAEEFTNKNINQYVCCDLSYQPFIESICTYFQLRVFMCFEAGFKISQVMLKLVEIIIEKTKEKHLHGAYIILDEYHFVEPTLLKKVGIEPHPDGITSHHQYHYIQTLKVS